MQSLSVAGNAEAKRESGRQEGGTWTVAGWSKSCAGGFFERQSCTKAPPDSPRDGGCLKAASLWTGDAFIAGIDPGGLTSPAMDVGGLLYTAVSGRTMPFKVSQRPTAACVNSPWLRGKHVRGDPSIGHEATATHG